jgi:ferrochelatase
MRSFQPPKNGPAGILLANTGTPAAPTASDLRRYLAQFLADPRVIEYPRWWWLPLLHGVILRIRPRRSAALYRRIWTPQGSPLLLGSQKLAEKLAAAMSARNGKSVITAVGMCYGYPSIAAGLRDLRERGAAHITVLPLFPQYSATTVGACADAVFAELSSWRALPDLALITGYHDHSAYIDTMASHIATRWDGASKLMFSFHGIPKSYVKRGDPYQVQCAESAGLVASKLGLKPGSWTVAYQSRFGPEAWLQPYTDQELERLGSAGQQGLSVVCPGFAVDCLETLDEIDHEGRQQFEAAGGAGFNYLPALNETDAHARMLAEILHSGSRPRANRGPIRPAIQSAGAKQ